MGKPHLCDEYECNQKATCHCWLCESDVCEAHSHFVDDATCDLKRREVMMKVRIQNDGQPGRYTKITHAETGESLDYLLLTKILIRVQDDVPTVILTSNMPVIDVIADATVKHICLYCGGPQKKADTKTIEDYEYLAEGIRKDVLDDVTVTATKYGVEVVQGQHAVLFVSEGGWHFARFYASMMNSKKE